MGVVESHRQVGAGLEALQVVEVRCAGVLVSHRNWAEDAGRLRERPIHLQRAAENGIEAGDGRAAAQGGIDQSTSTGSSASGACAGAASARTDRYAEPARTAARRARNRATVDAQRAGASLGAQNVGIGNVQVVALNGDIKVVLH